MIENARHAHTKISRSAGERTAIDCSDRIKCRDGEYQTCHVKIKRSAGDGTVIVAIVVSNTVMRSCENNEKCWGWDSDCSGSQSVATPEKIGTR